MTDNKTINLGNRTIDYKDIELLKQFIDPLGRIMPARATRLSRKNQRELARAIKHARFMGLLPYVAR